MYARIELMGHDTDYGIVRKPSRKTPGLVRIDLMALAGERCKTIHVGPGAVFRLTEMDSVDCVKAWVRRNHRGREYDRNYGNSVYLKELPPEPESAPVAPIVFGSAADADPLDPPSEAPETKEPRYDDDVPF